MTVAAVMFAESSPPPCRDRDRRDDRGPVEGPVPPLLRPLPPLTLGAGPGAGAGLGLGLGAGLGAGLGVRIRYLVVVGDVSLDRTITCSPAAPIVLA